ncbi:hypothetical protein HY408_01020 [Candidatus Gottesmanbacteria bacterium]|nr:hypothetical protein [Candidatus Gottesmanbacteria bacterium]
MTGAETALQAGLRIDKAPYFCTSMDLPVAMVGLYVGHVMDREKGHETVYDCGIVRTAIPEDVPEGYHRITSMWNVFVTRRIR